MVLHRKNDRGLLPKFSQELIESIKQRIVLSDLVGEHVSLKRRGSDYLGLCPFHQEKTPSFSVSDEKGLYYCFGCGAGGSCFDFVKHMKGLRFTEIVEELASRAGILLPVLTLEDDKEGAEKKEAYQCLEKVTQWYEANLSLTHAKEARDYLASRGIDESLQKRFRLGYAPDTPGELLRQMKQKGLGPDLLEKIGLIGCDHRGSQKEKYWDRFRGRIMFPIMDRQGRVIAFGGRTLGTALPKYLNSADSFLFHKSDALYGINELMNHRAVVRRVPLAIVEGYSDVIRLWEHEMPAVAPLGTALSQSHIQQAWRVSSEPVIIFDGDEPGQKAAFRAVEKAFEILQPGLSLKFCILPPKQDPDSYIQTYGATRFKEAMDNALSMVDFFWAYSLARSRVDTPEFIALFKETLLEKIAHIGVKDIKVAYEREILRRYYLRFSGGNSFSKKDGSRQRDHRKAVLAQGNQVPLLYDKREIQEKILVISLIYYPELMKDCLEQVCSLELKAGDLSRIREALVDYYQTQRSLEPERVRDYFSELEGISISQFLDPQILLYAPFLKKRESLEKVRLLWQEIWNHMQEKGDLAQEWLEMKNLLQEEGTQEAWLRLKAFHHLHEEEQND